MTTVTLERAEDYHFALMFLEQANEAHIADSEQMCIDIPNLTISTLLARLRTGAVTVLPFAEQSGDRWVVLGTTRHQIDLTLDQMSRFVLPSYGTFPDNASFPTFHSLPDDNLPDAPPQYRGYCTWHSPREYRAVILDKLALWLDLLAQRHVPRLEPKPTFRDLYARFRSSLAAQNWETATSILGDMRRLRLSTVDNLNFLYIQLLAQQRRWNSIWNHEDYTHWAMLPVPYRVGVALISAFYQNVLFEHEQTGNFDMAMAVFETSKARLGNLLSETLYPIEDTVVRVLGYWAVQRKRREILARLLLTEEISTDTRQILQTLQEKLTEQEPPPSPQEQFNVAMADGDYGTAFIVAQEIESPVERAGALLQIASIQQRREIAQPALDAYQELTEIQQKTLNQTYPMLGPALSTLEELARPDPVFYDTWLDWFDALFEDPETKQVKDSVEILGERASQDYSWTIERVQTLNMHLLTLMVDDSQQFIRYSYVQDALERLIDTFLDQQFPRESRTYVELYDMLYEFLRLYSSKNAENGQKLLRLADVALQYRSEHREEIFQQLLDWVGQPNQRMEVYMLDVFEMVLSFGLGKEHFYKPYRVWVERLLDLPQHNIDRFNQEVWLSFGEWLGDAVSDLTSELRHRLEAVEEEDKPFEKLPDGFHIVILTLDEASARRARELLLQYNETIRVDLSHEKVMTPQVKTLVSHADMVVVVTACIKHAVTDGIRLLRDDNLVHVNSRGSSRIVREIKQTIQQLF